MKKIIRTNIAKKAPMKQTVVMLALVLAIGIAAGMMGCQAAKAKQEPVKLTELLKTDLAKLKIDVNAASIFTVELAPGAATPKHYHPGHEFVYVLEGSGTVETEGKPSVTVKPGMNFYLYSSPEKAEYVHWATNTSKKDPLTFLVVLVTEKGQPLLIPVK